jgi:hypothetical protein
MPIIAEEEKQKRRRIVGSVIGTNRMDGIEINPTCQSIMDQYAEGHITLEEMSAAIDIHVSTLVAESQTRQAADELLNGREPNYINVDPGELQEVVFANRARRWFPIDEAKRIS